MNQALMQYLASLGFNQTTYNERIRAYLLSTVASAVASDSTESMWLKLGTQAGYPVFTVNEIQWRWARLISGVTGSWNDAFDNLPPFDANLNIVSNGNFADGTGWTPGTGWSIGAGLATKVPGSTADISQAAAVPIPGATYRVTATYVLNAGILYSRIGNAQSAPHTVSGTYVDDIVAVNSLPFAIRGGSTADGNVTGISVRRIA